MAKKEDSRVHQTLIKKIDRNDRHEKISLSKTDKFKKIIFRKIK